MSDVLDYFADTCIGRLRRYRRAEPLFNHTLCSRRKHTKSAQLDQVWKIVADFRNFKYNSEYRGKISVGNFSRGKFRGRNFRGKFRRVNSVYPQRNSFEETKKVLWQREKMKCIQVKILLWMAGGRSFHNQGTTTAKARCWVKAVLAQRTKRSRRSEDRRGLGETWQSFCRCMKSC